MDAYRRNKVLIVLAAFVLLAILPAICKPSHKMMFTPKPENKHTVTDEHECYINDTVDTLCQRCAKSTKSPLVYPMCCRDEEEVRLWCSRYLNFGRH